MARWSIVSSIPQFLLTSTQRLTVPCSNVLSRNASNWKKRKSFCSGPPVIHPNPAFFVPVEHHEPSTAIQSTQSDSSEITKFEKEESTPQKISLKDIPNSTRHLLMYQGYNLPIQVVIGKKGVDTGVLNCLHLHFRKRDVVRVKISKPWKDNLADIAQELEEKSGAIIIHRSGSRLILFRGYTTEDVPLKDPDRVQGWWNEFPTEHNK
eukprot:g179.t1